MRRYERVCELGWNPLYRSGQSVCVPAGVVWEFQRPASNRFICCRR
ncbi:unnamed protein product [Linum tenue]|nr:unnamed protein product [Linum tenue]